MDQIDQVILRAMQEDGRTSFTTIAAQAGVSETTIRSRYRSLLEQGIVRTVAVVDPYSLGFQAPAILGIQIEPGEIDRAARQIAALPEVSYVVMTLGSFDLFVEIFCRDLPHLTQMVTQVIQLIPGVRRTETLMISRSYKLAYRWSLVLDQENEESTLAETPKEGAKA
jgi:Lrp/AsnC family transcriptional regulator, regulator for asnA, asnC and gidA